MPWKPYKKESRADWGRDVPSDENMNRDDLQFGCLLRIADSLETLARDRNRLEADLSYYKNQTKDLQDENARLRRSQAALRGHLK